MLCTVDLAHYMAPTRQHDELDHTDQESVFSLKDLDHAVGIGDLTCETLCMLHTW